MNNIVEDGAMAMLCRENLDLKVRLLQAEKLCKFCEEFAKMEIFDSWEHWENFTEAYEQWKYCKSVKPITGIAQ